MNYPHGENSVTGGVVPVSALKSAESAGIGEFADLVPLGCWAAEAGLSLIQILPVNDTGYQRSPYSALSAFALHPVYARLKDFPEAAEPGIAAAIEALAASLPTDGPVNFDAVLSGKLGILRAMWKTATPNTRKETAAWADENPWVRNYALFSLLREDNNLRSWTEWNDYSNPTPTELEDLWKHRGAEAEFYIWLQWRLEGQLKAAAEALDRMGIALKGDIPILINDDSADVWAERTYFRLAYRAGAPPDGEAPYGQNWGFPTYDWNAMRRDDFRWWRARLHQASKFYHAYRIDHVLGFFRIWAVPEGDVSALMGHFDPSVPVTRGELQELGFDDGRITWLSLAHIPGEELRSAFGPEAEAVESLLERVGSEDLWRARPDAPTEKEVYASALSDSAKDALIGFLRNRTLVIDGAGGFHASVRFGDTRGWQSLNNGERAALGGLFNRKGAESLTLWEETGRELLEMMRSGGGMLVCAEDLGAVPDCVPGVLSDLGILGLKVTRWARRWAEGGQPYIRPADYPRLSVATSSVHDSTTLRGWLSGEAADDGELRRGLGLPADTDLSGPDGVHTVLAALQDGQSLVAAYPLQDLLALDPECVDADPEAERVNVPGTVQEGNWTWRMKPTLETLAGNASLKERLKALAARRRKGGGR